MATIIYTDHQNLTYFQSPQKLTRRQVRWVMKLSEYDIKLQHKAGRQMVVADALSRRPDHFANVKEDNENITALPEDLWIQLLDMELQDVVVKAQATDKFMQDELSKLPNPSDPPSKWSIEEDSNGSKTLFYDGRMYIPDNLPLRRKIVADHHDTLVAGHPSILATTRSVCLYYWWPGLQHFVRNYVNGCATCQQFKIST